MTSKNTTSPAAEVTDETGGERQRIVRGAVLSKAKLSATLGYDQAKINRMIDDGAPVLVRGSAADGKNWQIGVRAFVEWMITDAVLKASGEGAGSSATGRMSYEQAKRKDKEVQASIRELDLMKRQGELVDIEDVRPYLRETFANVRSRILSVPSQIVGLTVGQQRDLQDAINDALTDLSGEAVEEATFEPNDKKPKH